MSPSVQMIKYYVPTPISGNNTPVINMMIINYLYMAVDAAPLVNALTHFIIDITVKLQVHQLARRSRNGSQDIRGIQKDSASKEPICICTFILLPFETAHFLTIPL